MIINYLKKIPHRFTISQALYEFENGLVRLFSNHKNAEDLRDEVKLELLNGLIEWYKDAATRFTLPQSALRATLKEMDLVNNPND